MMDFILATTPGPREYRCGGCGQLRLCLDPHRTTCGACDSPDLTWGEPGTLPTEEA